MIKINISPEYVSAETIRCAHVWDHIATRIELTKTHKHDSDEHIVVCDECARLAGLLECDICVKEVRYRVVSGNTNAVMAPIYAPSELKGGRCNHHQASHEGKRMRVRKIVTALIE